MQIFARGVLVYLGVLGQKKPAVSGISISTSSYPQLEQLKANDKSTSGCNLSISALSALESSAKSSVSTKLLIAPLLE